MNAPNDAAEPLVLIVDDDDGLRVSMKFLFASVGLTTETYDRADAFLEKYPNGDSGRPGCIVLDVRMPGMSGLELQRLLAERGSVLPVIIVTGHGDVPMAVAALKSGAHDFIEKPFKEQALLELVEGAVRLSRERIAAADARHAIEARYARLNRREREVMERVLEGKANKVIAFELDLSMKTIEVYRAAVMSKMEARSVAELAQLAAGLGLKPVAD
jgi:two-component system, LuxR family, response regulator FixJ